LKNNLSGLITPIVTIYKNNGDGIDYEKMEEHIEFLLSRGVNAIIPSGSTGDFFNLNNIERKKIAETVINKVNNKIPVFIGTSALTTKEVIDLSLHAESVGASGVMISPPFYMPLSDEEIYHHFFSIAKELTIPIMIYNNPVTTGQHVTPGIIKKLKENANIVLLKDSSGSVENFQNTMIETKFGIDIFIGEELISVECMLIGAKGIISGLSNAIPEVFIKILELIKNNKYSEAAAIHYKLLPLYNFSNLFHSFNYNSVVKSLIEIRGLKQVTASRLPLMPLSKKYDSELKKIMEVINIEGILNTFKNN